MHGQDGEQDAEKNVEKEDDLIVGSAIFVLGPVEMFFEIEFACEHQGRADQGVERMTVHVLILQQHVKGQAEADDEDDENRNEAKKFSQDHF